MKEETVDIFDKWISSVLDDVHTIIPGQIVQYYGHTQRKAKVKLMVKLRNVNNQIVEIQPIDDVPVIFPGTKSFSFLFPLNKGDGVLVLFSEASIGAFLSGNVVADADDLNRFNLTDAIAIPGLWSFKNVPQSTTHIIELNAAGQLEISGTTLKLKAGTQSFIKGDAFLTELLVAFNAHTHPETGSTTGTPTTPWTITNFPTSKSTVIKGE